MGTAIPGNDHAMLFTRYDSTNTIALSCKLRVSRGACVTSTLVGYIGLGVEFSSLKFIFSMRSDYPALNTDGPINILVFLWNEDIF